MPSTNILRRSLATTVCTALALTMPAIGAAQRNGSPKTARVAQLPPGTQRPDTEVLLSVGEGELITLPANVTNVWTSNPAAADVYVSNPRQIHLFGKAFGEATVFATTASGTVVYSTNVRVSQNITSIDRMLKAAMPEANLTVTTVGQIAVLNGTVASPQESAQAQQLVTALLNPGVNLSAGDAELKIAVINRLKTATPLQVNLHVRIAEVSRSYVKNIGVNLTNRDGGSFLFGVSQGRQGSISTVPGTVGVPGAPVDANGARPGNTLYQFPAAQEGATLIGAAGRFLGTDLLASLDLGETIGQVTTLANPNLTALSGETATFLAGGEIPIPLAQGLGAVTVQFKQFGVSLAYTPTVLADGRISLRVRPEVSQLSAVGAVTIGNVQIPALTTRRAETTVELGSGQSFMIAGLMQNNHDNQIVKAPGLGDLPVLGALFRSNGFKRNETELVIVVTPYLVKPVNANDVVLPTDGYKTPTDVERVLLGQLGGGVSGGDRPKPVMAPPAQAVPSFGAATTPPPAAPLPQIEMPTPQPRPARKSKTAEAAPGFTFN